MKRALLFVAAASLGLHCSAPARSAELSSENQTKLIKNVDAYASRMSA